jgi:ubiquinone/menaquinone biosynthesis C-methylase UbiE
MTAETTDKRQEMRAGLHAMWAAVAPGWGENADFIDARGADLTARMLEITEIGAGDRVLELAAGPGGTGLAAAEATGDGGEVVISDVAAEMSEIAARRAAERGLGNVTTRVLDIEEIDEPNETFDVVLCREGLMLTTDPVAGASEINRVLRPGGRTAIAVWGPRAENPWLGLLLDAVGAELGGQFPPPGVPAPFSLDDAGRFGSVLEDGGLTGVEVTPTPVPYRAGSLDEWWTRTQALAGPLAKVLAAQEPEKVEAIRERAFAAMSPYEAGDGVEIPGLTLLASARG